MTFERDIREISRLVRTQLAHESSLRLIMIHHVLFQQNFGAENFVADIAGTLLDAMRVSHVVEERSFGWANFRALIALESFALGLPNAMNVFLMHAIPHCGLEIFAA